MRKILIVLALEKILIVTALFLLIIACSHANSGDTAETRNNSIIDSCVITNLNECMNTIGIEQTKSYNHTRSSETGTKRINVHECFMLNSIVRTTVYTELKASFLELSSAGLSNFTGLISLPVTYLNGLSCNRGLLKSTHPDRYFIENTFNQKNTL
ncbi:MAG TPA: hypothetical protein VJ951_13235 [Bacteroidales bacterium]|nr:hypothetical protein [Bacteroidales bacterium]